MKFETVDVQAYSGFKRNERPISFRFRGADLQVDEVLDRWYEGGPDAKTPCMDYFKVRAGDGKEYILRYNGLFDAWAVMLKE